MTTTKHIYEMSIEELGALVCMGYAGNECTNTMDEYGCRNSMKNNEAFCSECCADYNEGTDISCCG